MLNDNTFRIFTVPLYRTAKPEPEPGLIDGGKTRTRVCKKLFGFGMHESSSAGLDNSS